MTVSGQQMVTAELGSEPVTVRQAHRWAGEPVPAVTVRAAVELSPEDVAAVLFWSVDRIEELADAAVLRWIVADFVVNRGCTGVEDARCQVRELAPEGREAELLSHCRARAAELFTAPPPPRCGHWAQPRESRSPVLGVR